MGNSEIQPERSGGWLGREAQSPAPDWLRPTRIPCPTGPSLGHSHPTRAPGPSRPPWPWFPPVLGGFPLVLGRFPLVLAARRPPARVLPLPPSARARSRLPLPDRARAAVHLSCFFRAAPQLALWGLTSGAGSASAWWLGQSTADPPLSALPLASRPPACPCRLLHHWRAPTYGVSSVGWARGASSSASVGFPAPAARVDCCVVGCTALGRPTPLHKGEPRGSLT